MRGEHAIGQEIPELRLRPPMHNAVNDTMEIRRWIHVVRDARRDDRQDVAGARSYPLPSREWSSSGAHVAFFLMAPSDRPPKANGHAVLDPPARPPALSAAGDPRRSAPIVVVIQTKDRAFLGCRFVLDWSPVLVGSDSENDIVVHDPNVSPRHAHFENHDTAWWCVDDGSTDGLYIDDQLTTAPARLANGARIGIGSTVLKFLTGPDVEAQYHEEIYRMTIVDGLTQVYVVRYLFEALDKEWTRARRHGSALALLTIELDAIEGLGALPGAADRVLREFAGVLRRSVPRDAILARYRDERFAMILPEHALETAGAFAESLRERIANSTLAVGQRALRPTACIGVALRHDDDMTSADILQRAGRALDLARSRGRNQVECTTVEKGPSSGFGRSGS